MGLGRRFILVLVALSWSLSLPAFAAPVPASLEYSVKANYLVRFAAFVDWPAQAFADSRSPVVLCVAGRDPFSGHVFAFRGRRGDLVKLLWSDGDGMCLLTKRLERGRFVWPQADSGSVWLSSAQLSMLLEGIDWRQPQRTWQPGMAV